MGSTGKLAKRSSFYFISNVTVVLAGLVSMPIWTRLFTTEQYGLFSLFNVTLAFMVAFSKFGMQHATLRFFADVRAGKMAVDLRQYYSTMFFGGLALSLIVTGIVAIAAYLVMASREQSLIVALIPPVAACVVLQATTNILVAFVRAEQRAKLHSLLNVLRRYGKLALALLMIAALGARVANIFWGYALFGLVMVGSLALGLLRRGRLSPSAVSWKLLREGLAYGFPMIWLEVSNAILSLGDRYVLQYYAGPAAVGLYSVGYNTSQMAVSLLARPLRLAVVPMYLASWAEAGEEATRQFLTRALRGYAGLAIPLALGVSWFGDEIVRLIATDKFAQSTEVIPWVAAALAIHGGYAVYAAGLYIFKKTRVLMWATLAAAALNLLLNLWLVPRSGAVGAAQATLIAYVVLGLWVALQAGRRVAIPLSPLFLLKSGAIALLAVWGVGEFLGGLFVLWKIAIVVVLYGGAMLAVERDARAVAGAIMQRLRGRRPGSTK